MKKLIAFASTAAIIAALGCTTMSPDKKYAADKAPPLMKSADGRTELPPTKLSDARRRTPPDPGNIDETNYEDSLRRLDNDIQADKRAMTKVGR